jgi:protein-L-isoaspartate(D-aspartate) O-methyltransferase
MSSAGQHSRVERAMQAVERALFVPPEQRNRAGHDTALPIGWEQTISQPSLVARMTEELELGARSRVLEIGTGSGYQTAILAELASEVFTVERIAGLANAAIARLGGLGYRNIQFRTGDGALGWPEAAPFDGIIVTAAPQTLPPALVEQLKPGARLVVPLGAHKEEQVLVRVDKLPDGTVRHTDLAPVRFVPLVTG